MKVISGLRPERQAGDRGRLFFLVLLLLVVFFSV